MRKQKIAMTTLLQAGKSEVFQRLQKLETLQHVAAPYATFIPIDGNQEILWRKGSTFSFRFYLFGIVSFGIHTIHVLSCDEESGISTEERNKHVPVWNHGFILSQSIKRQRAIQMKWKSEPDGKRHLSPCGRKCFILTGSENGESSC